MSYDEMIAVITARKEGKQIEHQCVRADDADKWFPFEGDSFDFGNYKYRVKEPEYRPYANADEFFKACRAHGEWIFREENGVYLKPLKIDENHILVAAQASRVVKWEYDSLVEEAVWADDGSVCGIKEE